MAGKRKIVQSWLDSWLEVLSRVLARVLANVLARYIGILVTASPSSDSLAARNVN